MGSAWCQTALVRFIDAFEETKKLVAVRRSSGRSLPTPGDLGAIATHVPINKGDVARPGVVVGLIALVVEGEASTFESVTIRIVRPPILGQSDDDRPVDLPGAVDVLGMRRKSIWEKRQGQKCEIRPERFNG
jgi:hypothetical protein